MISSVYVYNSTFTWVLHITNLSTSLGTLSDWIFMHTHTNYSLKYLRLVTLICLSINNIVVRVLNIHSPKNDISL